MKNAISAVSNIGLKLLEPLSVEETYKTILTNAIMFLEADHGSVILEKKGKLERVYTTLNALGPIKIQRKGFAYRSFKDHKPYVVQTIRVKNMYPQIMALGFKTSYLIPLSYKDKSIGILIIQSKKKSSGVGKDMGILKLFGSMASLAIRKAQLDKEKERSDILRYQAKESEAVVNRVHKAGLSLLEPLSPLETYRLIVEEATKLVKANYGTIYLTDSKKLRKVYTSLPARFNVMPRSKGYTHKTLTENKPNIIGVKSIDKIHPQLKFAGVKSITFIPLSYQNKAVGVLNIQSLEESHFTQKELNVLKLFGSMASLAIRNSQLYDQIRKALQVRDLFISTASHELRTPLTTLNGYIQLLERKINPKDKTTYQWIQHLSGEAKRLTYLIKELLEINQIQIGQFHYVWEECNLLEVISTTVNNLRFAYPNSIVRVRNLSSHKNPIVIGDFNKLIQVMNNLLNNAAKFTRGSKPISVKLREKNSYFELSVTDKGKGISQEELTHIFEGFYKGKNHTEQGMGLGLFLAKTIIDQHNGDISVESKAGVGTTVRVLLPIAVSE